MLNSVIVVDDEASIRSAVEQWLSLSGFVVQLFSRAEECLAQLPRDFPGVILSDVRMPGMGGLELLSKIQALDADLPLILLTGHGDVPMAVEAMRDGAYDFLEKPFSPEILLGMHTREEVEDFTGSRPTTVGAASLNAALEEAEEMRKEVDIEVLQG